MRQEKNNLRLILQYKKRIEELEGENKRLIDFLKEVSSMCAESCNFCAFKIECPDPAELCDGFVSGVGATSETGQKIPDFRWDCRDFNFGTCDKLIDTPCNGCDGKNHWRWKG